MARVVYPHVEHVVFLLLLPRLHAQALAEEVWPKFGDYDAPNRNFPLG